MTPPTDLAPCLFCGSRNLRPANRNYWKVQTTCNLCGAEGPVKMTGPEADAAWNERPEEDRLAAENAQLRKLADELAGAVETLIGQADTTYTHPDALSSADQTLRAWDEFLKETEEGK